MALTVTQIFAEVKGHFPMVEQIEFLNIFNVVNNELVDAFRLVPDTMIQISLTSGTQEYALPTDVYRVWNGNYQTASDTYQPLTQTSVDRLDEQDNTWRWEDPSTPSFYYERGGNVGFYPNPDTSTSVGYPIVNLYVSEQVASYGINDSLPGTVISADAWIYRVCQKLSVKYDADKFQLYERLAEKAKQEQLDFINGKIARDKPSINARVAKVYGL